MNKLKTILEYLKKNHLILSTAESCTAGKIINLLARIPKSGESLDVGYVVYSLQSKKRLLRVKQKTINQFTLTSEEVAFEMCLGTLKKSNCNVAVATTGIAGSQSMDGIPPGTVCFAWGFKMKENIKVYTQTRHFTGTRTKVLNQASEYTLIKIPYFHAIYNEYLAKN